MCAADSSTVPSSRAGALLDDLDGAAALAPDVGEIGSALPAGPVPARCPLAQQLRGLQLRQQLGHGGTEELQVRFGERELRSGGTQVRGEDVGVVRVEDGRLHGLLEQRLGMVDEEGVQRVVAGHQDGQGALAGASGAARLLPQRRPGAGIARDDDGVQAGDVDAEFEGGGGGQAEKPAGVQGAFQGAALLGEIAPAVGGDPGGQGAVDLGKALLGDDGDQFGAAPGAYEGDRADALDGQIGEEVGGLGGGGAADGGALLAVQLGQRRFPQGEDHFAAGRGVVGDLHDRETGEAARRDGGLRRSGRGEEEDRIRSVAGAQAAQSAHHLGDVGAEDTPVGVALVDDDEAQGAQEGGPAGVGRKYPAMQHVGVGQDVVGVLAHPLALLDRGVAVVDRGPDGRAERCREFLHRTSLIGGQGLGGGEIQGGRATAVRRLGAVEQGGEQRGEIGERLAGRRAGGDDHGFAVQGMLGGGRLVRPRVVDPGLLDRRDHFWPDAIGPDGMGSRTRGQVLRMSDARGPARHCGEPVEDHGGRGARVPVPGWSTGAVILGHRHRVCHWRDGQWSQGVVHGCW